MKTIALIFLSFLSFSVYAQRKVIQLYNGAAPGSEKWDWNEAVSDSNAWQTKAVYNVSHPTLTVFEPDSKEASGTAVIICPGGAFHALSINSEGYDVARWLAKKGVTCFVLKYRLAHSVTTDPIKEMNDKWGSKEFNDEMQAVIPLDIADGRAAIAYVRQHASEYNIKKDKIGIIGFSAGGTVAASTAFSYSSDNRPDFVAPIYAYMPSQLMAKVAEDAPPMFIAAASDDQLNLAPHSVDLYNKWLASKHPVELHMYVKGGHGFGMRQQHSPTDMWIDRFGDWLNVEGFITGNISPSSQQAAYMQRTLQDWANLQRYSDMNKNISSNNGKRVVFMGNSITEGWMRADSTYFINNGYVDRGISGQTTPQMLIRFRPDVIDLKPAAVIILAGINDIAQNTGPMTLEQTFGNIVSMAELARANNIKVVICSVLPAFDFPWHPGFQPADKVIRLNEMLSSYCMKNNIVYCDYFSKMKDERNGLPKSLSEDGVHPNLAGYKLMEPLADEAIQKALSK